MNTPEQIQKAALDHERPMIMPAIRAAVAQADSEYNEEINKAFAAGADWALQQQRWIPVEEALPGENEDAVAIIYKNPFFGHVTTERGSARYSHEDQKWYSPLTGGRLIQIEVHNVTHWQHLAPLPTEGP